jgi:hypothetical protein
LHVIREYGFGQERKRKEKKGKERKGKEKYKSVAISKEPFE